MWMQNFLWLPLLWLYNRLISFLKSPTYLYASKGTQKFKVCTFILTHCKYLWASRWQWKVTFTFRGHISLECKCTSHSAYDAMSTESNGVEIDGFFHQILCRFPKSEQKVHPPPLPWTKKLPLSSPKDKKNLPWFQMLKCKCNLKIFFINYFTPFWFLLKAHACWRKQVTKNKPSLFIIALISTLVRNT